MPFFAADSYMNVRLPDKRRVSSLSPPIVAKLASWARKGTQPIGGGQSLTAGPPWVNQVFPVYVADAATPRRKVTLQVTWWLQAEQQPLLNNVPVPEIAKGNATPDKSLAIIVPGSGWLYELWGFERDAAGNCTARAAAIMSSYWSRGGVYDERCYPGPSTVMLGSTWGVQASGFSQLAGLVTVDEARAGVIAHATAFSVPRARAEWFASPAQRTDGTDTSGTGIPYGARFVLPPTFDYPAYCASKGFVSTRFGRIVVEAWKRYGAIPMDQTGQGVGLSVEEGASWMAQHPSEPNPWYGSPPGEGVFEYAPDEEMRRLPWESLQMLEVNLRRA